MMYNRLTAEPLPPYAFLPGHHPHPEKEGGHGFGKDLETYPISTSNYKTHQHYLYSLDLLNLGYFWESHVYLEAIWNENNRKGKEADLLKALIKIAAAGVKFRMNMKEAAIGHLARAKELFTTLPNIYLGINGIEFIEKINLDDPPFDKYLLLN